MPSSWSNNRTSQIIQGTGEYLEVYQSSRSVLCQGPHGSPIYLKILILPIPVNLWGCDLLEHWGVAS
jgi:hypothetical protein